MNSEVRKNLWFRQLRDPIVKVLKHPSMKAIPFLSSALNIVSVIYIIYMLKCSFVRKFLKRLRLDNNALQYICNQS